MNALNWTGILLALWAGVGIFAAGHALLTRRDPRAAWGWIAVCWLFPFAGPALYFMFGIDRMRTHARDLGMGARGKQSPLQLHPEDIRNDADSATDLIPPWLAEVARTADTLTGLPLLGGNQLMALQNGEQAYPRMIAAIEGAQQWIGLATYIFDNDVVGKRFVDALQRARQRGVDVHVLVDGFGRLYSLRPINHRLDRAGVDNAIFNRLRLLPPSLHLNLRNHRKLLLVDGTVGFTGGMNIGRRHLLEGNSRFAAADTHFELEGPVLQQLATVFADDWRLSGKPPMLQRGTHAHCAAHGAACRVITDGPNEDYDHLAMVMQAAISAAREQVLIMTPYFLPPTAMRAELQAAALRGVKVEIVLPAQNNLPFVHWATRNMLAELLKYGVRVFYQPPPFCHSKLFVVDGAYAQIGSANLDARSLKLNFEIAVEVYGRPFARTLIAHIETARDRAHELTMEELASRSLPVRLRDAAFWLFSPYL